MKSQLTLLEPRTRGVPLHEALQQAAAAWSVELGFDVRVIEVPHIRSGGYRIERTP